MPKNLKRIAAPLIIATTIGLFIYYIAAHPEITHRLREISPLILIQIIGLLFVTFVALAWVLRISLQLYDKQLDLRESVLLNAYSSIANFFGPGQSGPAVRGAYLYKKHGFKVKNYIFTTLLYYGCYAVVCAFLLCVGSRPWWQTAILVTGAATCSLVVIRWYARHSKQSGAIGIHPRILGLLLAATVLQMAAQTAIFFIELHSVDPHITIAQSLTYTGAASLALFVSLTPGAIGIREAFLVFSQNLHHISASTIVAANVIDRAIYFVFLGLLFIIIVVFHAKERFRVKT